MQPDVLKLKLILAEGGEVRGWQVTLPMLALLTKVEG